jgi:hypothetical protein
MKIELRPYIVLDNKLASTIPAHEFLAYAMARLWKLAPSNG